MQNQSSWEERSLCTTMLGLPSTVLAVLEPLGSVLFSRFWVRAQTKPRFLAKQNIYLQIMRRSLDTLKSIERADDEVHIF